MAATGALNAPPKRTAFGDVSNTVRTRVGDPIGKPVVKTVVKPVVKDAVKTRAKSVSATVGARDIRVEDKENKQGGANDQRLKANAASKVVGHGSKYPAARPSVANQQHIGASLAQPPLRNGVSKKIPAVYNDYQDHKESVRGAPSPVDDLAALVAKPVKNPRHYKSQPVLRAAEQQSFRHAQTKFAVQPENLIEVEDEGDIDDNVTEAAYEDAVEQLSELAEGAVRDALAEMEQASYRGHYHDDYDLPPQSKALPEPPVASELEEYWDEEEEQEQELYDEQGYTTAHSYRSHGDNTTSGPTTLIAPPVTTAVQEELDLAKEHVLLHQTEEELEEEAWDVSMVAEYGDEIFAYMRELEVIFSLSLFDSRSPLFSCFFVQPFLFVFPPLLLADPPPRIKCFRAPTTWMTRLRFSGRCAPSSWTGWFRCITASVCSPRPCSSRSTTSIASSRSRSSRSESCSSLAPRLSLWRPSTKRSTVRRSRRSSTWWIQATAWMRFSRLSVSC